MVTALFYFPSVLPEGLNANHWDLNFIKGLKTTQKLDREKDPS